MRSALLRWTALLALAATAACSSSEDESTGAEEPAVADIEIHRPFIRGNGSVNSYWLEGPDEIVVFDTQGNIDLARRVVTAILATEKPVTAIFISHYDPGHFGGLQVFTEAFPEAELLMSEEVAEAMERDLMGYAERLREIIGEQYRRPPAPTRIVANREEIDLSGVTLIVHVVDDSEADQIVMLEIPSERAILASDLVANRMHPDLTDADIDSWPRALDRLTRDFSGYTLYPGHGRPGPVNLLAANQIAYLTFVRGLVERDILSDDVASEAEINAAIAQIQSNYAGWDTATGRPAQLRRNLEALVAEMGGELEREERRQEAPEDQAANG